MILGFSTQINGKPTFFVERINRGLILNDFKKDFEFDCDKYTIDLFNLHKYSPKIHTIREDKNNRWQVGTKIDFFINVRQKNMFRFAPVLPVVSVQEIEIKWINRHKVRGFQYSNAVISINDVHIDLEQVEKLALNDGFDTIEDFFAYFNEDFKGKIIHWTDKRY